MAGSIGTYLHSQKRISLLLLTKYCEIECSILNELEQYIKGSPFYHVRGIITFIILCLVARNNRMNNVNLLIFCFFGAFRY